MSKLTSLQKEALLRGINQIPVNLIKKKIDKYYQKDIEFFKTTF